MLRRTAALPHRFLSTAPPKKPSTPRFQIPVHIALFTVLMIPVGLSMGYASHFGKSEDDLEAEIRARYQAQMDDSGIAEKNRHMGAYFQQVFHAQGDNKEVERQLRSVLEGGKDAHTKGRQRQYDALGEKLRQAAAAAPISSASENDEDNESSTKRKKRKKKKKNQIAEGMGGVESLPVVPVKSSLISSATVTTVASITAVATVAAVTGFVLGGSRRSS
ncbi:hypothetical protein FisN_14Lh280 [Fistulifera solaris]|uniref:Transmembrane protein n=1 Tax=Fistulifera solaris TaxID=1519565 RepID=A0A1Z5J9U5_FISSO|nr:hypothetical protein FisN_14Lh280 [Fistulifera solaris]|eukprot:GAX10760.1 hypothetical protein FisN_14Lh280 [Fistulifera solaris]